MVRFNDLREDSDAWEHCTANAQTYSGPELKFTNSLNSAFGEGKGAQYPSGVITTSNQRQTLHLQRPGVAKGARYPPTATGLITPEPDGRSRRCHSRSVTPPPLPTLDSPFPSHRGWLGTRAPATKGSPVRDSPRTGSGRSGPRVRRGGGRREAKRPAGRTDAASTQCARVLPPRREERDPRLDPMRPRPERDFLRGSRGGEPRRSGGGGGDRATGRAGSRGAAGLKSREPPPPRSSSPAGRCSQALLHAPAAGTRDRQAAAAAGGFGQHRAAPRPQHATGPLARRLAESDRLRSAAQGPHAGGSCPGRRGRGGAQGLRRSAGPSPPSFLPCTPPPPGAGPGPPMSPPRRPPPPVPAAKP
ncbi:basic salivary proline-rich protein 4-like [Indicator indicator]|uniref:basic salivary proline-rich protein 4-like n=1 Tax=Indicator indicator TaxID=1002788 RepID=UPI0023E018CC|nr:basic salivary proline-rich protein 4-like [Indicator indicator]